MKQITIYGRDTCAPCIQLKNFMKLKGYSYTDKSVDNPDYASEAFAYTGLSTVPVTVIEDDNNREIVSGLNLGKLIPLLA